MVNDVDTGPTKAAVPPRAATRGSSLMSALSWCTGSLLTLALASALPAQAAGDAYPSKKPVTIVAGFPAGGAADQLARLFAQKFSIAFNQSFVVENKAGAAGTIGAAFVARAPADGYTLLMGVTASQSIAPSIYKGLSYQPEKDFQAVSLVAQIPVALVVTSAVKAKTPRDFVSEAQARANPFSFASSGTGAIPHLTGELFQKATGAKLLHVPYKGAAPAMSDLLAGRVDVMFDHLPSVLPHIRSGKLRPLAIAGAQRASALPELPTLAELGVPGVEVSSWFGLLAPAGTPMPVVEALQAEVVKILATPEAKAQLQAIGADPVGNSPAEFSRIISADVKKWAALVKATGVTAY
ncbi:MAG: tripartite tricarboxylate transporter substrate binding protein [Lacisediminimonas sp.]|nr:tripartite tricarboxylate transporter substrate binding protein [Lacisediminimonas sp.]